LTSSCPVLGRPFSWSWSAVGLSLDGSDLFLQVAILLLAEVFVWGGIGREEGEQRLHVVPEGAVEFEKRSGERLREGVEMAF
jgi:hypothetical protein